MRSLHNLATQNTKSNVLQSETAFKHYTYNLTMLLKKSTDQLKADIAQLKKALGVPNLPNDESFMHTALIEKIQEELDRRALSNEPLPNTYVGANNRSNSERLVPIPPAMERLTAPRRTILAGNHSKTPDPITNKIEVAQDSNRFNPAIIITWSDGYQLTVDETAATGRFKSTFRDTLALRCVAEGRYTKMWRWDTPWRAAGFYRAITAMRDGIAPTLKDLGYTYPSERQREVFALITKEIS